jgi:hypothetical protein
MTDADRIFLAIDHDDPGRLPGVRPEGGWNVAIREPYPGKLVTPLQYAIDIKSWKAFDALIRDGADPHQGTEDRDSPFQAALKNAAVGREFHKEILQRLWRLRVPLAPRDLESWEAVDLTKVRPTRLFGYIDVLGKLHLEDLREDLDHDTQNVLNLLAWHRIQYQEEPPGLYQALLEANVNYGAIVQIGRYWMSFGDLLTLYMEHQTGTTRNNYMMGVWGLRMIEAVQNRDTQKYSMTSFLYYALGTDKRKYSPDGWSLHRRDFDGEDILFSAFQKAAKLPNGDVPLFPAPKTWIDPVNLSAWEMGVTLLPPAFAISFVYTNGGLEKLLRIMNSRPELEMIKEMDKTVALIRSTEDGRRLSNGWTLRWRIPTT